MKMFAGRYWPVRLGVVMVLAGFSVGHGEAQNRELNATYGSAKLKAGFVPDPYVKNVEAGGPIQTKLGGVNAWISNAPDFKLFYEAGKISLTIHVESRADTTLLINLPDGTWVADDDSGGSLNPQIRFATPQSGRYDIWVGTLSKDLAPATLKITELK